MERQVQSDRRVGVCNMDRSHEEERKAQGPVTVVKFYCVSWAQTALNLIFIGTLLLPQQIPNQTTSDLAKTLKTASKAYIAFV